MPDTKKRTPPFSLSLPEDLSVYLRAQAKAGFRSLTAEIVMRLELTRSQQTSLSAPDGNPKR